MFGLPKNKAGVTYGAIIDVGSGSVGVGILESDQSKKLPRVIYSHREYMRVTKDAPDKSERLKRMREALFTACLRLGDEGLRALAEYKPRARVERILVTCSSPWSHTITRDVHYKSEEEFKVTKGLMADLVDNAQSQAAEQLAEDSIIRTQGLTVVERATVDTRVNGYQVHDPFGRNATELSLSQITGLVPQDIIDAVHEVQEKILTKTKLSTHTYMMVMYCVLRDLYPKTTSLCIVDVTGESTEIGIIEGGVLQETKHAPFGSSTLLRTLGQELDQNSESIIAMLRSKHAQDGTESDTKELDKLMLSFDTEVERTFASMYANRHIPFTIITTATPQLQSLFATRIPRIAHKATEESYATLELDPSVLEEIAENGTVDVFIALASRFFHKLHGCGEIETL